MKEFNLEEAKAGKPVCTRDGRPARIICWDRKETMNPLVALIEIGGIETAFSYTEKGELFKNNINSRDLMMASEKKEGWINLGRRTNGEAYAGSRIFDTKEKAHQYGIGTDCFATIKIEWEE